MAKKLYDYQVNEEVKLFLLIKSADVRVAKNGKKFIAYTFQDSSGSMDGKYWDATDDIIENYQAGDLIRFHGKRELYNNAPQLRIYSMRPLEPGDPENLDYYMKKSPVKVEDMQDEINEALLDITQPNIHRVVRYLLNKYQKDFFQFPAAKTLHHAFPGGLAYHTVSMLRIARTIVDQYEKINSSLLYAGVILHDLGKVMELTGPVSTEYTLKGNLLGHIVILDEEISKACLELGIDEDKEEIVLLKHMILSHHGQLEYGSPVRPRILEAEVLHMIDNLDASITMISDTAQKTDPGQFSERLFGLDNRSFYIHDLEN